MIYRLHIKANGRSEITFIEAIIVHVSVYVDVFPCCERQLHLWVIVWAIIWVVASLKFFFVVEFMITESGIELTYSSNRFNFHQIQKAKVHSLHWKN